MGAPLSCTGSSLAYRREVWEQVGGFDDIGHLISGDDVYFLRLVAARTDWRVVYCADVDAVVTGAPGPTATRAILDQEWRHPSTPARLGGGARRPGGGARGRHRCPSRAAPTPAIPARASSRSSCPG